MKLTMWIFADWLKKYHPKMTIQDNPFAIEAVRLFSANMEWDRNTLYIGRLCDFFHQGNGNVLCTHSNDMLLLETDDLEEVLNEVLNAFEYYNAWNNRMLELLTSNAMLPDLFSASGRVLPTPLFLLDAGFRLLAHHENNGIRKVDSLWDELLLTGNVNTDFLIRLNQSYPKRFREKGIYVLGKDVFPHRCYNRNFFFQNDWVGTLVLVDLSDDVSQGTLDLFALFWTYLNRWFQIHIQEQHSIVLNRLLQAALTEKSASTKELARQLVIFGWKETDPLRLIQLDAPYQPFIGSSYLCRTLNDSFSDLYAVPMESSICLLCNTARTSFETFCLQLRPWLVHNKYYGVFSQPFPLSGSFYDHYKYARLASGYCPKQPGRLYDSTCYSLPYMFYEMKHTLVPPVLHPALAVLRDYDLKNHGELFYTFYCYLKNERSLIRTARELKLHRNSLSYRLNRIFELINVDLEDYGTRLSLLLSYEIMDVPKEVRSDADKFPDKS